MDKRKRAIKYKGKRGEEKRKKKREKEKTEEERKKRKREEIGKGWREGREGEKEKK